MESVSLNGKVYGLDKVLALVSQSAKTNYNKEQIAELKSLDTAVISDKTKHLIITPFEGVNVVLVKPSNYEEQIARDNVSVAFYSKFLIKKLNTENVIIDTAPIDNRPRYDNRDRYDRNDRPRTYERRDGYRSDNRNDTRNESRSFDRNPRPAMNRSYDSRAPQSSAPNNGFNNSSRPPQRPRLFDTPRPSVNRESRQQ